MKSGTDAKLDDIDCFSGRCARFRARDTRNQRVQKIRVSSIRPQEFLIAAARKITAFCVKVFGYKIRSYKDVRRRLEALDVNQMKRVFLPKDVIEFIHGYDYASLKNIADMVRVHYRHKNLQEQLRIATGCFVFLGDVYGESVEIILGEYIGDFFKCRDLESIREFMGATTVPRICFEKFKKECRIYRKRFIAGEMTKAFINPEMESLIVNTRYGVTKDDGVICIDFVP